MDVTWSLSQLWFHLHWFRFMHTFVHLISQLWIHQYSFGLYYMYVFCSSTAIPMSYHAESHCLAKSSNVTMSIPYLCWFIVVLVQDISTRTFHSCLFWSKWSLAWVSSIILISFHVYIDPYMLWLTVMFCSSLFWSNEFWLKFPVTLDPVFIYIDLQMHWFLLLALLCLISMCFDPSEHIPGNTMHPAMFLTLCISFCQGTYC